MSEKVQARKLKGFRDYGPQECSRRESMIQKIRSISQVAAFEEISTPALEYQDVLLGSGGGDTDKEVYHFVDHGERPVAMRFDLTVPFARYVAENQGTLIVPFKKFQVGEVWRGEKPQKGRYRQFCQVDFDIVGVDNALADVEVMSAIMSSLAACAPGPVTILCGHRILLVALARIFLGDIETDAEKKVLIALDKLRKIGPEATAGLIVQATGRSEDDVAKLLSFLSDGSIERRYEKWGSMLSHDRAAVTEWQRYDATVRMLQHQASFVERIKIVADLGLARGLGYYTGIVFEGVLDEFPEIGSISGGGRYNELVSRFSHREFAGVGGSVGVDRLLAGWELKLEREPETSIRSGVLVAIATDDAQEYGQGIVVKLRQLGIKSDIGLQLGKLGNQFKYADRRHFQQVITVGTDEVQSQTFAIKNLATGEERRGLSLDELAGSCNLPKL